MPIVQTKPTAPIEVKPTIPVIHSADVTSNVVDTKYDPLSSLLTYIEGSYWEVDYYSQVITKDSALAGQDVGQSAIYQQYKVIRGFELRVVNALSWIQDSASKSTSATGSAHVHSLVIPNQGDMFLADAGDGREGVFQITMSERKGLLKDSVYFIEYQLIYFSDTNTNRRADLDSKVVQEFHYSKDFLHYGQNPLLVTSEFEAVNKLKSKYSELINHYFRWFFSSEFKTLIIPGQDVVTYDHFLVEFMSSILNTTDNYSVRFMRRLNVDDDHYLKEPQIWSAILNKDLLALKTGNQKMGLVSTRLFSADPMLEGIRYTGVRNVVYPSLPQTVYAVQYAIRHKTLSETILTSVNTRGGNLEEIIYDTVLNMEGGSVQALKPVLVDDYYVLSQSFYEDTVGKSLMEILLLNYFEDKTNNAVDVLNLTNSYENWGGLERFYYIPILLVLIKNVIRSL